MNGRIISVKEVEGTEKMEGYAYREIIIQISEVLIPLEPHGYTTNWKEVQEQQSPFHESQLKRFERYEKSMKRCRSLTDELDSFHIGSVEITQIEAEVGR